MKLPYQFAGHLPGFFLLGKPEEKAARQEKVTNPNYSWTHGPGFKFKRRTTVEVQVMAQIAGNVPEVRSTKVTLGRNEQVTALNKSFNDAIVRDETVHQRRASPADLLADSDVRMKAFEPRPNFPTAGPSTLLSALQPSAGMLPKHRLNTRSAERKEQSHGEDAIAFLKKMKVVINAFDDAAATEEDTGTHWPSVERDAEKIFTLYRGFSRLEEENRTVGPVIRVYGQKVPLMDEIAHVPDAVVKTIATKIENAPFPAIDSDKKPAPLYSYIKSIVDHTQMTGEVVILGLAYFDRMQSRLQRDPNIVPLSPSDDIPSANDSAYTTLQKNQEASQQQTVNKGARLLLTREELTDMPFSDRDLFLRRLLFSCLVLAYKVLDDTPPIERPRNDLEWAEISNTATMSDGGDFAYKREEITAFQQEALGQLLDNRTVVSIEELNMQLDSLEKILNVTAI